MENKTLFKPIPRPVKSSMHFERVKSSLGLTLRQQQALFAVQRCMTLQKYSKTAYAMSKRDFYNWSNAGTNRTKLVQAIKDLAGIELTGEIKMSRCKAKNPVMEVKNLSGCLLLGLEFRKQNIIFVPNPILTRQVESYFILKPETLLSQVDTATKYKLYVLNLFELLSIVNTTKVLKNNEDNKIKITITELCQKIGLGYQLQHDNRHRTITIIESATESLQQLQYIDESKLIDGVFYCSVNVLRFQGHERIDAVSM